MHSLATDRVESPTVMAIEERIGANLHQFGDDIVPMGYGRWWIKQAGESQTGTLVAVDEDWLVVEQPLSGCRLARIGDVHEWSWRLLGAALELPSGARPVLPAQDNLARIRAEYFLAPRAGDNSDDDFRHWLASACEDVAAGSIGTLLAASDGTLPAAVVDNACSGPACDDATRPDELPLHEHAGCSDIPALCELAGWPASARGTSTETRVPLPARGGDVSHALASVAGAAIRFRTALTLAPTNESAPACLGAVAVALLRLAGSVRRVRATLIRLDGNIAAALDVRTQLPLGPENVNDALSSLAVARQQVAAEVAALAGDDELASAYLTFQGLR